MCCVRFLVRLEGLTLILGTTLQVEKRNILFPNHVYVMFVRIKNGLYISGLLDRESWRAARQSERCLYHSMTRQAI
jgi:hypothetical protein